MVKILAGEKPGKVIVFINKADSIQVLCEKLAFLGVKIDDEKNAVRGEEIKISTDDSKVNVYIIPTNEELAIARDTLAIISK